MKCKLNVLQNDNNDNNNCKSTYSPLTSFLLVHLQLGAMTHETVTHLICHE